MYLLKVSCHLVGRKSSGVDRKLGNIADAASLGNEEKHGWTSFPLQGHMMDVTDGLMHIALRGKWCVGIKGRWQFQIRGETRVCEKEGGSTGAGLFFKE